jgi:subtilisin family serine protease
LWETDGGVRTNHIEFGTRVRQRDGASLDISGHATQVAGTMAAGGVGTLFGSFYEARGVAYQARVFAYDTAAFKTERESAAAGMPSRALPVL